MKLPSLIIPVLLLLALDSYAQEDKRIIFPAEKQLSLFNQKPELQRFTPSINEIDSADGALRRAFNELERRKKEFVLEDYYRQYTGYLDNGQRIIYVTGACIKTPFFTNDMVSVGGQGSCFFEAAIALPSRQLSRFLFKNSR